MNTISDITDQYACFQEWRAPLDDEVETVTDWLADQDPSDWSGDRVATMKHHIPEHVRTGSVMAGVVLAGWPVKSEGHQMIIC